MPRKGENIYKRKDGRWEGRYIKGHRDSKTLYGYIYGKTYKEVKEKLLHAKTQPPQQASAMSQAVGLPFSAYARLWLSEKETTVKYSTYVKYRNLLEGYINPTIGNANIDKLGYDEISNLCITLMQHGGKNKDGLSPKMTSDCLTVVKSIIRYAARKKCNIDSSVFEVSVKLKNNPLRVLSMQEQDALLVYLRSDPTPINVGILISLFTGIRIGELCALQWKDVSIESKTISVNKTLQRVQTPNGQSKTTITITEPKSDCSIRQIPIPNILIEFLTSSTNTSFYVLTNSHKYVEPRTVQNHFKSAISNCKIADANFHALRHTFATRCIEVGFDIKSLSEILGHANVNITLDRYVHPSMDLKKTNMDKLSSLFSVK